MISIDIFAGKEEKTRNGGLVAYIKLMVYSKRMGTIYYMRCARLLWYSHRGTILKKKMFEASLPTPDIERNKYREFLWHSVYIHPYTYILLCIFLLFCCCCCCCCPTFWLSLFFFFSSGIYKKRINTHTTHGVCVLCARWSTSTYRRRRVSRKEPLLFYNFYIVQRMSVCVCTEQEYTVQHTRRVCVERSSRAWEMESKELRKNIFFFLTFFSLPPQQSFSLPPTNQPPPPLKKYKLT